MTYLDSPMVKVFRETYSFFGIWLSSSGSGGSKLNQKCKLSVRLVLVKIQIFQRFFKHYFCLLNYYHRCKFQIAWWQYLREYNLEVRDEKHSKMGLPWILIWYADFWKLLTWQPQMLYRWNLPQFCTLKRSFLWQKIKV